VRGDDRVRPNAAGLLLYGRDGAAKVIDTSNGRVNKVVTVFGMAGGVGTTTVAALLGRVMAKWRLPTVLVDANLYAPRLAQAVQVEPGSASLERFASWRGLEPLRVDATLGLVPGLHDLRKTHMVRTAEILALLDGLAGTVRIVDTAPFFGDEVVYATLRCATDVVVVAEDVSGSIRQMARYRRLFEQIRMPWDRALLVVNHSRPGPDAGIAWEDETGIAPVCVLPWQSVGGYVVTDSFLRAGEALARAVLGGVSMAKPGGAAWAPA